jgi:hypothetical protein
VPEAPGFSILLARTVPSDSESLRCSWGSETLIGSPRRCMSHQSAGAPVGGSGTMAEEIVTKVFSAMGITAPGPARRLSGRLDAVSLADLAQLFSWARSARGQPPRRSIFRLSTDRGSGYLFLEAGMIHAALFGEATGLQALGRMLSLESGTFESCERDWPPVGNVGLEIGTALLRARELHGPREAAALEARGLDRFTVRVADSVPLEGGGFDDSDPSDPSLAALCRSLYGDCQELGQALDLPSLTSARLANDGRIVLLFPEARARRVSAVLGLRHVVARRPSVKTDETPGGVALPSSLGELRAVPEVVGAFVATIGGELISCSMPRGVPKNRVAVAAAAAERLLACTRPAGFSATMGELRFGDRRLVLARRGAARVAIVALSSLSVPWLRELAAGLARRLGEPPRMRRSVGASPQGAIALIKTRP